MTKTMSEEFLALIDEKLDQVLEQPAGWGGVEALEPVVLVLLMLRNRVADPTASEREVIKSYRKFLAERTGPGASDLRARLGSDCSIERMVEILREHVECAQAAGMVPTVPPEVPGDRPARQEQPAAEPHYLHRQAS
jgi:hypothetical protein